MPSCPLAWPGPRNADASRGTSPVAVGGIRGTFAAPEDVADVHRALTDLPRQVEQGFTTICFKPAMSCASVDEVPDLCRLLVDAGNALAADSSDPGDP